MLPPSSSSAFPRSRSWRALLCGAQALALFFIIVGANWAAIDRFGSAMPDADQWDAEGLHLLVPWFEGGDFWRALFQPHNEHRLVLTKLQALALVQVNGQWDARLEAVANALLHAAVAVAFWLVARRWVLPRWHAVWFLLLALLFGLPLAWENILGGFHSQQYWLLGLSFAAIVALPFARPRGVGWWAAAAAAAGALLAMGSGLFAAAVVFALSGFRRWRRETIAREAWPTLVLTLFLFGIGVLTRVEVPYHEPFKAQSVGEFVRSMVRSLAWPVRHQDGVAALLWAPWLAVAWHVFRPSALAQQNPRAAQTILALGAWVLLQIAATAYARGAGADYPAPRYTDTVALGAATNALALAWLLSHRARPIVHCFAFVWLIVLLAGLAHTVNRTLGHEMPGRADYYREAEAHLRGFLATNDPAQLAFLNIPYPDAAALIHRLNYPTLRARMPAEVRPPLTLTAADNSSSAPAFLADRASQLSLETTPRVGLSPLTLPLATLPTWGSFGREGLATLAEWRSAPVSAAPGGWLRFHVAGQPGAAGATLELQDAATGALLARVQPSRVPGDAWRVAYVRTPARPFAIVARDTAPDKWLAFSAPTEMASLSHLAWRLAKHGRLIAAGALVLAVVAAAAGLLLPRPAAASPGASPGDSTPALPRHSDITS